MDHIVYNDKAALAQGAADMIAKEIASHTRLNLGVAGGSTPRATHDRLTRLDVDWSNVTTWMTDERWVPADHPDSNQRMVEESLVLSTGVRFLAPDTSLATPMESASSFEEVLTSTIDPDTRSVTMLGIGTDGHTASLFPGTSALDATGLYVANEVPQLDTRRLTATFDLLAHSTVVVFLVAGAEKAPTVAAIADGANVPAARVHGTQRTVWLLDHAAAAEL